jgi:hypothetical protein
MASRIMPIPTIRDQQALGRGILPAVALSVVATLAVIALVAVFFLPDNIDPRVRATLRAGQQQTTSGIAAINDRPAAEKFLAQTRGTRAISDSLAAEEQFMALSARLSTLQDAMTRILRDNADLAEQLRAAQTQITQMAQDHASVAEQLKGLTQMMARRPGGLAMGSEERERRHRTTPRKPIPEVGRPEVTGALAARRPAGASFPAFQAPLQR